MWCPIGCCPTTSNECAPTTSIKAGSCECFTFFNKCTFSPSVAGNLVTIVACWDDFLTCLLFLSLFPKSLRITGVPFLCHWYAIRHNLGLIRPWWNGDKIVLQGTPSQNCCVIKLGGKSSQSIFCIKQLCFMQRVLIFLRRGLKSPTGDCRHLKPTA